MRRSLTGAAGPCDGCGICCDAFPLPPFDANEEAKAPDGLLREIEEHAKSPGFRESAPCFWQDPRTKRCRHHDVRPTLCRWFEPGGKACNELRAEAKLPTLPGKPPS